MGRPQPLCLRRAGPSARGGGGTPGLTGLALLGLAALLLVGGAELFAGHASAAGRRLGVSGVAVGLLVAGGEPEELITAVLASLDHRPGLAVGDAIGANVTMLTLALGLAAAVRALPVGPPVARYALGAAGAGALALGALADDRVSRIEGGLLVATYAALAATVWILERRPPAVGEVAEVDEAGTAGAEGSASRGLGLALLGLAAMGLGGWAAVTGAVRVSAALHTTDTAVGLTLVALATSAELLALAWAAVRRDVGELAVAAVLGSAAYNATATLGAAALARPIVAAAAPAAFFACLLPLAVVVLGGRRRRLARPAALVLLAAYGVFVAVALR